MIRKRRKLCPTCRKDMQEILNRNENSICGVCLWRKYSPGYRQCSDECLKEHEKNQHDSIDIL